MTNWLCTFICSSFSNECLYYGSDAYIKIFAKSHLKCHCMSENKCKSVLWKANFLISALNPWEINGKPSQQFSSAWMPYFLCLHIESELVAAKSLVMPHRLFFLFFFPFTGTHWLQRSLYGNSFQSVVPGPIA